MSRLTKAGPFPRAIPLWRILAVSAIALTTANCAGNPQKIAASSGSGIDPKYGVKASPRLYNEGDTIPKGGGRRFSGKPYVVAGRTYVPREDAKGYVREGLASWYGAAFHGRMTANGEVFDRQSIAAAHPTMPLPSYARVTNLANGHSMIVRVNDRGPYHADRVMDVSEEVAQALEFRQRGTARVRVEYVGKASTAGSDDRKLLATLRTDGQPAGIRGRSPIMLADLGPEAEGTSSERLTRAARPALAFKPTPSEDETGEGAAVPRPARASPVLMASARGVAVPAALQPTASRSAAFRPSQASAPLSAAAAPRIAAIQPKDGRAFAPLGLGPPMRSAFAGLAPRASAGDPSDPKSKPARGAPLVASASMPGAKIAATKIAATKVAATKIAAIGSRVAAPVQPSRLAAARPAPLPAASKLTIAKLATMPTVTAGSGKVAGSPVAKPAPAVRRAQIAEIY